jgi:mono/diheme cytochrome c family protein
MRSSNGKRFIVIASLFSALAALASGGCKKGGEADAALIESGKTAFASNRCSNCHSINGQGGRRAPDLTHVGADPKHTAEWIAAYVKNPKSQDPASRMPAFGARINDQDLKALGAYLSSLK